MRTGHHGESNAIKANQMPKKGLGNRIMALASKSAKKFYNRKRRMFLKNPNNFDKL